MQGGGWQVVQLDAIPQTTIGRMSESELIREAYAQNVLDEQSWVCLIMAMRTLSKLASLRRFT